jgi:hypothetical protein
MAPDASARSAGLWAAAAAAAAAAAPPPLPLLPMMCCRKIAAASASLPPSPPPDGLLLSAGIDDRGFIRAMVMLGWCVPESRVRAEEGNQSFLYALPVGANAVVWLVYELWVAWLGFVSVFRSLSPSQRASLVKWLTFLIVAETQFPRTFLSCLLAPFFGNNHLILGP